MNQSTYHRERHPVGSRRRAVGALSLSAGLVFSVLALSGASVSAYSYELVTGGSELNSVDYWNDLVYPEGSEQTCTKNDSVPDEQAHEFTADQDYAIVVLKSATGQHVYSDVVTGDVLNADDEDGRDFDHRTSHIVTCPALPVPPTTVPPTTVPPTTAPPTTAPPTTAPPTTIAQPTTTVLDLGNLSPLPPEVAVLPSTGSGDRTGVLLGGLLVLMGGTLLATSRRTRTS